MTNLGKRMAAALGVAALAGGGAGAGAVLIAHHSGSHDAATTSAASPSTGATPVARTESTVGQVARAASPGVVEIVASQTSGNQNFGFGGSGESSAEGSGFVYDLKGDILTNEHVIDGAGSLRVHFADGSSYPATVVGSDTSTDLAVVHVSAPAAKLHPLTLGNSSGLQVGDGVIAIGSPFGLENTVTSGIVSATGREITAPDQTPIEGAIQTDAPINHGNSGGPLLDLSGQVIGITSQIESDSGGNDGVGFAIPSNTIRTVVSQLLNGRKVQHALLGVNVASDSSGRAKIASVESGTGAASAGLRVGDIVTAVDGVKISSPEGLRAAIDAHRPGDTVTITVLRGGSTTTLHATLGTRS
jgi:putative serine protease PepD